MSEYVLCKYMCMLANVPVRVLSTRKDACVCLRVRMRVRISSHMQIAHSLAKVGHDSAHELCQPIHLQSATAC